MLHSLRMIEKPLNLSAACRDQSRVHAVSTGEHTAMKIALLGLLGLMLGALGGAALGIGVGLAWIDIFKTTSFEGYSGMLVFLTFMPAGGRHRRARRRLLFGVMAARDAEIAIEREPARPPRHLTRSANSAVHLCNAKLQIAFGPGSRLFEASNTRRAAFRHGVANDAIRAVC